MTTYVLVDDWDTSFFTYTGSTWTDEHTGDKTVPYYRNSTFYSSTANDESVTFSYTGSDFQAWGGLRHNHGMYAVQVDSGPMQYYSGLANPAVVPGMLYGSSGLPKGDHDVTIWNKNAELATAGLIWFDIDFVVYNAGEPEVQPTMTSQNLAANTNFPASSLGWSVAGVKSVDNSYTFATYTGGSSPTPSPTPSPTSSFSQTPSTSIRTMAPYTSESPSAISLPSFRPNIGGEANVDPGPGVSTESGSSDTNKILTIVIPSGLGALLPAALVVTAYIHVRRKGGSQMHRLAASEDGGETIPSRLYRGTGWTRSIQTFGASTARY